MANFDFRHAPVAFTQQGNTQMITNQLYTKQQFPTFCAPSLHAYICERVWWQASQAAAYQHQAFLMSP